MLSKAVIPVLAALGMTMVGCGVEDSETGKNHEEISLEEGIDSSFLIREADPAKPKVLGKLKPADHRMVTFNIPKISQTDMSQCSISDLRSNEIDFSGEPGDLPGDFALSSSLSFSVRAEYLESGTGREYDIEVTCNNSQVYYYQVLVPKKKKHKKESHKTNRHLHD